MKTNNEVKIVDRGAKFKTYHYGDWTLRAELELGPSARKQAWSFHAYKRASKSSVLYAQSVKTLLAKISKMEHA